MKRLFNIGCVLLIMAAVAFAQLPLTCTATAGRGPMPVSVTVGGVSYSVSNATWSAGTAVLTIGANTLSSSNVVIIQGIATQAATLPSGYNGEFTLTAETSSTISYALPANPGTFVATANATVTLPGSVYYGTCINGLVYQIPVYGVSPSQANLSPTVVTTTAGFGTSMPFVCHAQWSYANDGGSHSTNSGVITPVNGCTIPAKSAVIGAIIYNSTQAVGATATLTIGWSGLPAGLMTAGTGAVANLTGSVFMTPVITGTYSTWQRVATALPITFTIGTADMTAGVVDVYVLYVTMPV